MSFATEVKRLREEAKLSQAALAGKIGVNQAFVSLVESGNRPGIGAEVLYKLCDALGVGCDHFRPFLTGTEVPAAKVEKPARGQPKKGQGESPAKPRKPRK